MCRCGTAFLLMDTIGLEIEAGPELPEAEDVNPVDLSKVIANEPAPVWRTS